MNIKEEFTTLTNEEVEIALQFGNGWTGYFNKFNDLEDFKMRNSDVIKDSKTYLLNGDLIAIDERGYNER